MSNNAVEPTVSLPRPVEVANAVAQKFDLTAKDNEFGLIELYQGDNLLGAFADLSRALTFISGYELGYYAATKDSNR